MELNTLQLLRAKVMHKRLWPKVNRFTYGIYYLALPLHQLDQLQDGWRRGYNRPALVSFHDRDHGPRDGSPLLPWIRTILQNHNLNEVDGPVVLMCMPRVLGYVFNPVSFWLCHDRAGQLRAVLCEVNNTFGETHSYLCRHGDGRPLGEADDLRAEKVFHVSPFLPREGDYQFRFSCARQSFGVWIDYFAKNGQLQLATSVLGQLVPLDRRSLRRAFWGTPLLTLRAIFLIHWQALKLLAKGIRYVPKPNQLAPRLSQTLNKFNPAESTDSSKLR